MAHQLYRNTTIGHCLQESLDELMQYDQLTPALAMKVLLQFDKAISTALTNRVKSRLTFRARKLNTYRFCDNVWTLLLSDVEFREVQDIAKADRMKIVAMDGRVGGAGAEAAANAAVAAGRRPAARRRTTLPSVASTIARRLREATCSERCFSSSWTAAGRPTADDPAVSCVNHRQTSEGSHVFGEVLQCRLVTPVESRRGFAQCRDDGLAAVPRSHAKPNHGAPVLSRRLYAGRAAVPQAAL